MKRLKNIFIIALCFVLLSSVVVSAKSISSVPYEGYEYNSNNISVPAPIGFLLEDTITSDELKITNNFGNATNIIYDGTNSEYSFMLLNTGNQIVKLNNKLEIIAYYNNLKDAYNNSVYFQGRDFAANNENGYYFIPSANAVNVFAANGKFLKQINAASVKLPSFTPSKVVHAGDEIESYFYVSSGSNYVMLDSQGDFVETFAANGNIIDMYYNSAISSLFYMTSNSIVDVTDSESPEVINLPFTVPANSSFTVDANGLFYICYNQSVVTYDGEGEIEVLVSGGCQDVEFNVETNQILVLKNDQSFSVDVFVECEFFKKVKTLNVSFDEPKDILKFNNEIFILNSGNGSILKTDIDCKNILAIYEGVIDQNNQRLDFTGASGIWIDKNNILYIADTENKRVIVTDFNGNAIKVIEKPEELATIKNPFDASKIVVDNDGNIYVVAQSINQGALVFTSDFQYKNFFGSNKVEGSAEAVLNYFRRKFATKEQASKMKSFTPVTISNMDIDEDGFIFMVTQKSNKSQNTDYASLLKKQNYKDSNIFGTEERSAKLGDLEWDRAMVGSYTNSSFVDVDVDEYGWINVIDSGRGKLFQYSPDGELISVYSGMGNQSGMNGNPTSLETVNGKTYVLDDVDMSINIFTPTEYVLALQDAFLNMDTADLDVAVEKWNEVLKYNSNNTYAYFGLGIAYENAGLYEEAMEYYKLANAKTQYSKSFRELRKEKISENGVWILIAAIVLIVLLFVLVKKVSKLFIAPEGEAFAPIESKKGMPLYVLLHPADGFAQFRLRNVHSAPIAIAIVVVFFVANVLKYFETGFVFNANKAVDYNLIMTLVTTVGLYALFVISNMAIATFLNGKGKLGHVLALTSYSMIPWILSMLINVVLSNFLSLEESAFMTIITVIGIAWSLLLLIVGTMHVHEYTMLQTICSLILTVVAMLIFAVLLVLLLTLLYQTWSTIASVVKEISLR